MKKTFCFFLTFLLVFSIGTLAQFRFLPDDPYTEKKHGPELRSEILGTTASSYTMPAVKVNEWSAMTGSFGTWASSYEFKSLQDIVKVGVNYDIHSIAPAYKYQVALTISCAGDPTLSGVTYSSKSATLVIDYDPVVRKPHTDLSVFKFSGSAWFQVTINGIYPETSPGVFSTTPIDKADIPDNFFIESEIRSQRYDKPVKFINPASVASADARSLHVFGNLKYSPGHSIGETYDPPSYKPASYELEWTYIDDYQYNISAATKSYAFPSASTISYDFRKNATRVQLDQPVYDIPLIYEHGAILYRFRMLRPKLNNYQEIEYSDWTLADYGTVSTSSAFAQYGYLVQAPHTTDSLNWQYTINFAEQGKYKHVINYFDGSLKDRQTQTRINSNPDKIVAVDKVYDFEGRPAIVSLPTPVTQSGLYFHKDILINNTTDKAYKANDFDLIGCSRPGPISELDATAAAHIYYSPLNPDKSGMQQFVPDAEGYPMVQTVYSPDNTNKVSWQGGAGKEQQLSEGHGTQYEYIRANQLEMDKLLGTEVGYHAYYPKQIVTDPNGQASYSVLNPQGKVIISALQGASPDDGSYPIDQLSNFVAGSLVCNDLLHNVEQERLINGIETHSAVYNDGAGNNTLSYSVKTFPYYTGCSNQYLWTTGYYDVQVTDDCGVRYDLLSTSGTVETPVLTAYGATTGSAPGFSYAETDPVLSHPSVPKGKLLVDKKLTFSEYDIRNQVKGFVKANEPECYRPEDYFVRQAVENAPVPCKKEFEDPADDDNDCDRLRRKMIKEMWPSAKYGTYESNDDGSFKDEKPNSIFTIVDKDIVLPSGAEGTTEIAGIIDQCNIKGCGTTTTCGEHEDRCGCPEKAHSYKDPCCNACLLGHCKCITFPTAYTTVPTTYTVTRYRDVPDCRFDGNNIWTPQLPEYTEWHTSYFLGIEINVFEDHYFKYKKVCCAGAEHIVSGPKITKLKGVDVSGITGWYDLRWCGGSEAVRDPFLRSSIEYGTPHSCSIPYYEDIRGFKDVPIENVDGKPFAIDPKYRYQSDCGITFPAEKWHNGKLYRDLANLDPQTLIEIFDDEIAEALLPLHPEYCKLLNCEASSGTFERTFEALETYQEAEAAGMYSLDDIVDKDPLPDFLGGSSSSAVAAFENALRIPFRSDRAAGVTTIPSDLWKLDRSAATQVYCGGGNYDEMLVCAGYRYATEIGSLSFGTGELKQRYFELLKALYIGNRNLMKEYHLSTLNGSTACMPCDKYRMVQIGEPIFPPMFAGAAKDGGTFDKSLLDDMPEWKRTMYIAAMDGTPFDMPSEIASEHSSMMSEMAEAQANAIMEALKDCPYMGDPTTLRNLFRDQILEKGRLSPTDIQDLIVAFTGSSSSLNDLCNNFLVSYGLYPDNKRAKIETSNFACGNDALLTGLQDFLNRPQVIDAIKSADASGYTSSNFILNTANAFENEIHAAVAPYSTFNVKAYLYNVDPSCASGCVQHVTLFMKGRSDIYLSIQGQVSGAGNDIKAFGLAASPDPINFQNVKCLNEELSASTYGLIAQRTASIEASCGTCAMVAPVRKYFVWNSFTDLMISTPDAASMADAITCIDISREVENFKTDAATYKYSTRANHPHFQQVLTNYLNHKFNKRYSFREYQALMQGCALSDVLSLPRELANMKIEFSSNTAADNYENTTLPAIGPLRPGVFRFRDDLATNCTAFVDLSPVNAKEVSAYITGSMSGSGITTATAHYNTADNDHMLFTRRSCTFSSSVLPSGAVYAASDVEVWENGEYRQFKKHVFRLPGATAKQNADMQAAVLAYLDGSSGGDACKGYYVFWSNELMRSADYSTAFKQAYLNYVYGLSSSITGNRASLLAALDPAVLPANMSGYSGITFTYNDPYIKGNRKHVYGYYPIPIVSTVEWGVLNTKVLEEVVGPSASSTPFPDADLTPVLLSTPGESLKVIRKANGDYWYRFFGADDKMYNVYICPPDKGLGRAPHTYTISLSSIEMGPLPNTFFVTATSTTVAGTITVKCSGYTDFPLMTTLTASDVILDKSRKGQFPFDSLDCEKDILTVAVANGKDAYRRYFEENVALISKDFMNHLVNTSEETLVYCGRQQQYQATLYYYDRVGNLTRTVPPAGVVPLTLGEGPHVIPTIGGYLYGTDDAELYRSNPEAYETDPAPTPNYKLTDHRKVSSYRYNSLNQLVWQQTPDGGVTTFFYDAAGRQIFSQNTEQRMRGMYTYNLYDEQGRPEESGQVRLALSLPAGTVDPDNTQYIVSYRDRTADVSYLALHPDFVQHSYDEDTYPYEDLKYFIRIKARDQVVMTTYDNMTTDLGAISGEMLTTQENLRSRVSAIQYYLTKGPSWYTPGYEATFSTYYSYDLSGNVKTITYDYPRLSTNFNQRYKRVDYDYDLVSGKVNMISYNRGRPDQFYQQYDYDADNRITTVNTSNDGIIWNKDARYEYYQHGPLARMSLGEHKVQSLEYAYTIQGWLKAINGDVLNPSKDMGQNGLSGDLVYPPDVIAHALRYFDNDYKPIGTTAAVQLADGTAKNLYNGNITQQTTGIAGHGTMQRLYQYDQLQRLKLATNSHVDDNALTLASATPANLYKSSYSYDMDGNINTLERWDGDASAPVRIDNFTYTYEPLTKTNKLLQVEEDPATPTGGTDLQPGQPIDNYTYDRIGNLIRDKQGAEHITWDRFGKVLSIRDTSTATSRTTTFAYDGKGNRIFKETSVPLDGGKSDTKGEYYVRDAGGNILSVYHTHSVYEIYTSIKWGLIAGGAVTSPVDAGGTATTDVLIAYSGRGVADGLKGLILGSYAGWADIYTDRPVSFFWEADPTLRSTLLYSGTDWIDALRSEAPAVHREALLKAGADVKPLFSSALNLPTEGRRLLQYFSTEMPTAVCQSLWSMAGAAYVPGNHVANANSLYSSMQGPLKTVLIDQMSLELDNNYQTSGTEAPAFYGAVIADNTIWNSTPLRAMNGPWTSGLTLVVNSHADDNDLMSFFDTWVDGAAAFTAAVTPDYKLTAVYDHDPRTVMRDMALEASIDELTTLVCAVPDVSYFEVASLLEASGVDNATLYSTAYYATSGDTMSLGEHHIYGSSRLGVQQYPSTSLANITHLPEEDAAGLRGDLSKRKLWYDYTYNDVIDSTQRSPYALSLRGNADAEDWNTDRTLGHRYYEMTDHLGNVLATVLDRKTGTGSSLTDPTLYDHWSADIASSADYYPGGMMMPGKNSEHIWSRHGYNGQAKDDEVYGKGNLNSALFWEMDTRTLKRWDVDPKPNTSISPYTVFNNNPIMFNDPLGDTTHLYDNTGSKIGMIPDKLPNEIHFTKFKFASLSAKEQAKVKSQLTPANSQNIRNNSAAYIGEHSIEQMKFIAEYADAKDQEVGFVITISPTRELQFNQLPDEYKTTDNGYALIPAVQKCYSSFNQAKAFGAGHAHYKALIEKVLGGITQYGEFKGKEAEFHRLLEPSDPNDYQPVLHRQEGGVRGQSPLILITTDGFAVYGSEGGQHDRQAKVKPNYKNDVYKYKSFQKK